MIELSLTAKEKIQDCLQQNPGTSPRISFKEEGVAGPVLTVAFEEPQAGDMVQDTGEFRILIAEDVSYITQSMVVNYGGRGENGKFVVMPRDLSGCDGNCNSCKGCEV